jgi:DNA-binding transcriptional MerR regulator
MKPIEQHKLLKIGDLAKQAGKSVRALHLYEELGLLTPKARSQGGFRLFDESAVRQIRWIELLQESGFSLHDIQKLLRDWQTTHYGPEASRALRESFQKRLLETRDQLGRIQALERELQETLQYLHTCDECAPVRTTSDDCPQCPVDHGMKAEPALVAGFHIASRMGGGGSGIPIPLGSKTR